MSNVTVVMPQTIPSMVSRLRVVLRLSATQASRMISINIDSDCAGLPGNQAVQKQNAKALTTEDTKVHKGDGVEFICAGSLWFMPFYPPASNLKASIGSTEAALRAGYNADSTAMPPNNPQASKPVFQVGNNPAKKSGMGSKSTSKQIP
jgi:hypothetical protein